MGWKIYGLIKKNFSVFTMIQVIMLVSNGKIIDMKVITMTVKH
ncbi:hypothetical protein Q5M85_05835 [Paraclostridium bifermentans]|nr:hypothetical protein [Paraclostridium bifermentans]